MPVGTKVGLGPSHIVLDGDPASPPPKKKGQSSPIFGPCLLWPNSWMDQDATWNEGRPRPRPHCVRWGPSSPKRGNSPPILGQCLLLPNGHPYQLLLSTCCRAHECDRKTDRQTQTVDRQTTYATRSVLCNNTAKSASSLCCDAA